MQNSYRKVKHHKYTETEDNHQHMALNNGISKFSEVKLNYLDSSSRRAQLYVSFLLMGLRTVKFVDASACSGVEEDEEGVNSLVGGMRSCNGEMGLDSSISLLWVAGAEFSCTLDMTLAGLDSGMVVTSSN